MDDINFRKWLKDNGISKKMQSDIVSRIRKLERALGNCDVDEQYRHDKCAFIFSLFKNKGENIRMNVYKNVDLPIGKYELSVYKYALNKYVKFIEHNL